MARLTFSATVPGDMEAVGAATPSVRIRAVTGRIGDQVVCVGGVAYLEDGTVMAFGHITDEARRHPVALHKAGLGVINDALARSSRRLVATADPHQPAAERWLERLGFVSAESLGISPSEVIAHKIFIRQT